MDREGGQIAVGLPNIQSFPHADQLTSQGHDSILRTYENCLNLLDALNDEPSDEISKRVHKEVGDIRAVLEKAIRSFDATINRTAGELNHAQAITALQGEIDWAHDELNDKIRPYLRQGSIEWRALEEEADRILKRAEEISQKTEDLEAKTRRVAEEVGVGKLGGAFAKEAKHHEESAKRWLRAGMGSTLALLAAGAWLYFDLENLDASADLAVVVAQIAGKALVVGVASYMVTFASRTYRSNSHMAAAYRQRGASITTFELLSQAMPEDAPSREVILGELAKSIFASHETGLISTSSGDKTIVETTVPLMSTLRGQA